MIMKQKEKAVYTKRICIRLKETEFNKLEVEFKNYLQKIQRIPEKCNACKTNYNQV